MDADQSLDFLLGIIAETALAADPAAAAARLDAAARDAAADPRVADVLARLAGVARARLHERDARRELEVALLDAQRLESVGRLSGGVAHDFNNMLTAIIGYMDLVATGLPPDSEEQVYITQALEAAEQATDLTRQMLAFARRQPAPPAPQNLNHLLDRLAPLVRRLMPENVRFTSHAKADPAWVLADAGQIEQVIVNLALRARDAMPDGGVLSLSAINVPGTGGAPDVVALEAVDTGEGMDADALRRALEPFAGSGAARGGARGLELAIAAALVRGSGGRVEADSDRTGGTRVRASWPVAVPPGARSDAASAVAGGHETVLFVEDDASVRELAAAMLGRLGYAVVTAEGAEEALRRLEPKAGVVDLLVADLVLPGMSGRELVQRAREARPGLRVLLTSGYAASPGVTEIAGGLPFLPKPFTGESLGRRVRETLDAPPATAGDASSR